jgi:hypothetical protein
MIGARNLAVAVLALFLVGVGSACSKAAQPSRQGGEPYRVLLPSHSDQGGYRLAIVDLFTLVDLEFLKGSAALFLLDPQIRSGTLTGAYPHIQYFRDAQGVITAKDQLSLQLLSTYAHMEKLQALDAEVGAQGVLSYPRTIAINLRSRPNADTEGNTNNAFYTSQYDALVLRAYTKEGLPFMANAGVLAHEHFHALFQKLVTEPLMQKNIFLSAASLHEREVREGARGRSVRELYHRTLLRGINEGFADLWGWIYSGDDAFVGRSLPAEDARRRLDVQALWSGPKDRLANAIEKGFDENQLVHLSYFYGTQLARVLRQFSQEYAVRRKKPLGEVRKQMAHWLIESLPALRHQIENLETTEYLELGQAVLAFAGQVDDLDKKECILLMSFVPMKEGPPSLWPKGCQPELSPRDLR